MCNSQISEHHSSLKCQANECQKELFRQLNWTFNLSTLSSILIPYIMSALIAHKLVKAPLMAAIRPSASFFRFNSTSTSSSTSVTEAREPVALQAEIISGAPGE